MRKTLAAMFAAALVLPGPLASAEPALLNLEAASLILNPSASAPALLGGPGHGAPAQHGNAGAIHGGGGEQHQRPTPPRQDPPARQEPPPRRNPEPSRPTEPNRPTEPTRPSRPTGPLPGRRPDGSVAPGQPQKPTRKPPVFGGGRSGASGGGHAVPKPQIISDRDMVSAVQRGNHDMAMPNRDDRGKNMPVDHGNIPSQGHTTVIHNVYNNKTFMTSVAGWGRDERGAGRYYWHDDPWGNRLCHHWDGFFDWYVWYIDGAAISMRWYGGYFWYYDPVWGRWVYLYNDAWWYPDPIDPAALSLYDQDDGEYYQYQDTAGGVSLQPEQPADGQPSQPQDSGKTYYSGDGTRMVQVTGPNADAFLYDTADPPAFEPAWLGSGTTGVYFQTDANGALNAILVVGDNGSFGLFDENGVAQGGQPQSRLSRPSVGVHAASALIQSASFTAINDEEGSSGQIGW